MNHPQSANDRARAIAATPRILTWLHRPALPASRSASETPNACLPGSTRASGR